MNVAIIPYDEEFANDNHDDVSVSSNGNDMSTLQHQIAILEAQLKQTRSYNERTMDGIEALDNLEHIDYMTITFDEEGGDESSRNAGQNYVWNESLRDNLIPFRSRRHGPSTSSDQSPAGKSNDPCTDSLYHRQEKWASTVEKKLEDARLERADSIMSGFTGRPQLASTEASWHRAKAAHDAVVRQEGLERKKAQREGQEKAEETLGNPTSGQDGKLKATTLADQKRQADHAERLARPRSIAVPPGSVPKGNEGDNGYTDIKDKTIIQKSPFLSYSGGKQQAAKTLRRTPTVDDLFTDVGATYSTTISVPLENVAASNVSNSVTSNIVNNKSFAEMNDHEFSHIMRRLGIKSVPKAKEENSKKKSCAAALSLATLDKETASKLPLEAYLGLCLKSNGGRPPRSPGGGRFVSSVAQAKLFKKITDQEREAFENKIKEPAKSAGTTLNPGQVTITKNDMQSYREITSSTCSRTAAPSSSADLASYTIAEVKWMEGSTSIKEPYQRYEASQAPFFDKSSSDECGRFRVRDASSFDPTSMRRVVGPDDGVMLLVGEKNDDKYGTCSQRKQEYAITILFDRKKWNEEKAEHWWREERHRFI